MKAIIDSALGRRQDILIEYPILAKYNFEYERTDRRDSGYITLPTVDTIQDLMKEVGDLIFYCTERTDVDVHITIYDFYVE